MDFYLCLECHMATTEKNGTASDQPQRGAHTNVTLDSRRNEKGAQVPVICCDTDSLDCPIV